MLGAIIGDTIGSVFEFHNTKDYDFTLFSSESNFTDDSIMSMAIAQWLIIDLNHSYKTLEEMMVKFAKEYPCPKGGYGGGFHHWLFNSPGGRRPYRSWGNGSAMRCSAVGWFFETLSETERVAKISAEITHNHPEGIKGAQATSAAIWMARNGKDKFEIKDYIQRTYGYNLERSWKELHETYNWDSSCQGTVPEAIICFIESTDFEDAIRKAVSIGGDSDTLACITGGIAEAFYQIIPEDMILKTIKQLPDTFLGIIQNMGNNTFYKNCFPKYVICK